MLNKFFDPKSVAVIGASEDPKKVGYALLANLKNGDPARKLYPVTLAAQSVLGIPAFSSVSAIPDAIDLAIIAIKADTVPKVLEECGKKKISAVILISAGFKEEGAAGAALERRVQAIAKKYHIALLGPNCLGVVDSRTNLNASFSAAAAAPLPGHVAILSQSGASGAAFLDWAAENGVGISKFISLGNETVLDEKAFLEYLGKDAGTNAIILYVEKVTDGKRFLELMRKISPKKPVVILKAGRSARGQAATLSHTGALALADDVFTAACRENGAILIDSLRTFFNFTKLFHMGVTAPLRRIAILTNGGGPSVVAADLVEFSRSLELVSFDERTKAALRKVLPPMAAVGNPVDVIGDALPDRYDGALKILTRLKNVDTILAILTPQMMTDAEGTARVLLSYRAAKPIIPIFIGGASVARGIAALREGGLANFDFPKDAIEVLDLLARGAEKTNQPTGTSPRAPAGATKPAAPKLTPFKKMAALLRSSHLPLEGILVRNEKELAAAWKKTKGPAALKVISPDFTHKSDAHAITLNLQDLASAQKAREKMLAKLRAKNPRAKIEGTLLQPMRAGKEIMIGMKRDPVFGPAIVFGLGGIFVEALHDTVLRTAPITPAMAMQMIREIKGSRILSGIRGEKPVRLDLIVKQIVSVSRLALAHPEIKELDLNPIIVNEKNAFVVDARMVLK